MIAARIRAAIAQAAADGVLPVALLDVDSSLVSTGERHRRILVEFAHDHGDPALVAVAHRCAAGDFHWSVDEPVAAAGLLTPALGRSLRRYWGARFFSDRYADVDVPTDGAVAFVDGLVAAGVLVVYLTARDRARMTVGTVRLLQRWGFPIADGRSMLVLKPDEAQADHGWKASTLGHLAGLGRVVLTLENEPGHANAFLDAFPEAVHLLLGDTHGPDAPAPAPGVVRVPTLLGLP